MLFSIYSRLDSMYTEVEKLEPHQANEILQVWEEMEPGALPIRTATAFERLPLILQQVRLLKSPLRSSLLLIEAVNRGFQELVESLINAKANVNSCNERGETPYALAIEHSHLDIAKVLRAAGADVNAIAASGMTGIHSFIATQDSQEIHELIKAGAEMNQEIREGMTPLMHAVHADETEACGIVSALLDGGANMHAVDAGENTPLHYAVLSSSPTRFATAALLCARGANLYAKNSAQRSACRLAKEMADEQMVKVIRLSRLIEHVKNGSWANFSYYTKQLHHMVHQADFFKRTLLMHAAMKGDAVLVRYFMAAGARTDKRDTEHRTALYYAWQSRNVETIQALEHGTAYAVLYQEEWQAEMKQRIAIKPAMTIGVVEPLLPFLEPFLPARHYLDPICKQSTFSLLNRLDPACFQQLCTYLKPEELTKLDQLQQSFPLRTAEVWRRHVARLQNAEKGAPPLVQHMQTHEARVLYREMQGLQLQFRSVHYLNWAILEGRETLVHVLSRIQGLVHQCNQQGITALMVTASCAMEENEAPFTRMMTTLIEAKANVNAQDSQGWTAISYAIMQNSLPRVKLLVNAGADLHRMDMYGRSPLMHAAGLNINIYAFLLAESSASEWEEMSETTSRGDSRDFSEEDSDEESHKRARTH